jgi:predicted Zn-dependent protease
MSGGKAAASALLERGYFEQLRDKAFATRRPSEHWFMSLGAESSQFVRLNAALVRQIGTVEDADLGLTLVIEGKDGSLRTASASTTLSGLSYVDHERVAGIMADLRREVPELPCDPYAQLPRALGSSDSEAKSTLPRPEDAVDEILGGIPAGVDIAGIYAAGRIARAMANTAGQLHWFSTGNFSLDYSLYTPAQRALKGTLAGPRWDAAAHRAEMEAAALKLALLERPARRIERGKHRTYLEPAAFADLVLMVASGALGEAALRQGDSPMRLMRAGADGGSVRTLSPLFGLSEDFSGGEVPRFNDEGELAPERLSLIDRGKLVSTLVSARTATEYGVAANGAAEHECLRAPAVAGGSLARADAAKRLGTGLYLSNLHYLNWSDEPGGRITGMTRYACFWVESGEIVAPIENLRFDDSIFTLMGSQLEDLTRETAYLPDVGTYGSRSLGGIRCPGALLGGMEFTL